MPGLRPSNPSPYWSPGMAKNNSLQDYLQAQGNVMSNDYLTSPDPEHDYIAQAQKLQEQIANLNQQSAINSIHNATPIFTHNGGGNNLPMTGPNGSVNRLEAILRALRGQESGGRYGAVNSSSGALGAYQVMPSNIAGPGGWDVTALGHNVGTQEFLHSRSLQDAIARHIFGGYLNKYGLKGALSTWYSGDPNLWNNRDSQGNYPSIHDYVMQVLHRLGFG